MITTEIIRGIARAEAFRAVAKETTIVSTTDATATVLFSIEAGTYERGVIECTINGIKDDGITGISFVKVFSYKTDNATLTVHSSATIYSQSDFTTATVSENANGFLIEVKVTGEAATNITWEGLYEQTKTIMEVAL